MMRSAVISFVLASQSTSFSLGLAASETWRGRVARTFAGLNATDLEDATRDLDARTAARGARAAAGATIELIRALSDVPCVCADRCAP